MPELIAWPPEPPSQLGDLYELVAERLGSTLKTPSSLGRPAPDAEPQDYLVVVESAEALAELTGLFQRTNGNVVAVVSDGYLGTDGQTLATAMHAGAAVTAMRSVAVRRGTEVRANVVCVPESLFGEPGSQRGPLRQPVGSVDVAETVAFFLDPSGGYLSGQVLFANGGRHLFSSLTA